MPDYTAVKSELERLRREAQNREPDTRPILNQQETIEELYITLSLQKRDFQKYFNQLKDTYALPVEKCTEFAKLCAVWEWILTNYKRTANSLENLYAAYCKAFPAHLDSKHSLSNYMRDCKANGIENTVIDQRAVKKVQKRISEFQYAFIQTLFIQSAKNTARLIHQKLVAACSEYGEKPYSLASVKIYMREFENNVELYGLRYGQAKAQKQMPFASLLPAEHANTQWQADGWTLPFWGENFQRYVLYCVWDNHSRKIVGYSIGKSESTVLILDAFDDAMRNTGMLPAEIVTDKHSFHTTEIAAAFKDRYAAIGGVWTVTTNAQRNQIAERYNQYLDELCKDFAGYTGKNVTAKGKNARLKPEEYEQLAKTKNMLTEQEITAIAIHVACEYNDSPMQPLNGNTPNIQYANSESPKAFAISEQERVRFIRPIETYLIRNGQVTIKIGIVKHEFQLPASLYGTYNNQRVKVVYEDLQDGIYIFDIATDAYICTLQPKQKMHGAIADQTEEDKRLLNQQAGRKKGTIVQARKKAQEQIAEGLKNNPEAIDLINHYSLPKDIRQLAQQDRELKRHMADRGINENMMPIRQQAAATTIPENKTVKTKESPFTTANHQIRMMTPEEIFGTNNTQ